ncbi:hypothetical protein EDD22DRAFT_748517, partial [Suillus occidentalis]
QNSGGPSASNNYKLSLYETELCRPWEEKGSCRTFWVSGACPYGKHCYFIHIELPVADMAPGVDSVPTASNCEHLSSDGSSNESSISLLQRIQCKGDSTLADASPPSGNFFNARPPIGSLHINTTSALNNIAMQNK